jgi:hypothetical protein
VQPRIAGLTAKDSEITATVEGIAAVATTTVTVGGAQVPFTAKMDKVGLGSGTLTFTLPEGVSGSVPVVVTSGGESDTRTL